MITKQSIFDVVVERLQKQDNHRIILEAAWDPSVYKYGKSVTPIGCFIPDKYYLIYETSYFGSERCHYLKDEYRSFIFKSPAFKKLAPLQDFLVDMNSRFIYISISSEHEQILKFLNNFGLAHGLSISEELQNTIILL